MTCLPIGQAGFLFFRGISMYTVIGHTDTLMNLMQADNYDFYKLNTNYHIDLPRLKKADVGIQVFAVFVEEKFKPYYAVQRTLQIIDKFYIIVEKSDDIVLIKDYDDIKLASQRNKLGAILAVEGADGVFDLSALRNLYRLGVRMLSLTWNNRNHLADGVGEVIANGGLTKAGRDLIKEMNNLHMIIDVSHINKKGFWDIIRYSSQPILASHSNANSICRHPRNLDDEQLHAIAAKNGLVGINFCPIFLTKNKKSEIKDIIKHIDYIKDLIGSNYISLGTDFDGIMTTPEGMEDVSNLTRLQEELIKYGYSESEIKKIFYKNYLNFLEKIWKSNRK